MLTPEQLHAIPVNAEALDLMPESVARENLVLAIAVNGDFLRLILPASMSGSERYALGDKIRFILNRSFTYDTADDAELARLIDLHYRAAYSTIQNCHRTFRKRCPKRWADLARTDNPDQRWCMVCERTVTFCLSDNELDRLSSAGQCVAFFDGTTCIESLGLIELD